MRNEASDCDCGHIVCDSIMDFHSGANLLEKVAILIAATMDTVCDPRRDSPRMSGFRFSQEPSSDGMGMPKSVEFDIIDVSAESVELFNNMAVGAFEDSRHAMGYKKPEGYRDKMTVKYSAGIMTVKVQAFKVDAVNKKEGTQ